MGRKLNICLHNIVPNHSRLETIYDLTMAQLEMVLSVLRGLRDEGFISTYDIFFDDGYASFRKIAEQCDFGVDNSAIHGAIITEQIGKAGKLSLKDLEWLRIRGFTLDPHGVSHTALAIIINDALLDTPTGGKYQNTPYGREQQLSSQEVLYQLKESSKRLEALVGGEPTSFVLPYGLYNGSTVTITKEQTTYKRLYTCDPAFDEGQFLAPRLLITQENIGDVVNVIRRLPDYLTPLPQRVLDTQA